MNELWGRVNSQVLTCIACCQANSGDNLVLAGNKLGQLVAWRLREGREGRPEVVLVEDCGLGGDILHLSVHVSSSGARRRILLFAGSIDGRIKLLELKWDGEEKASAEDMGLVWDQEDLLLPRAVVIVKDTLNAAKKGLRVLLSKGIFLLALDLQVDKSGRIVVASRQNLPPFPSSIVSLVPWEKCPSSSSYLVFTENGAPVRALVGEGRKKEVTLNLGSTPALPAELESPDFRTLAALRSSEEMGAVVAVLQGVCAFHDHLVLRSPVRLLLLAPYSAEAMLRRIFDDTSPDAEKRSLAPFKNCLETLRVLVKSEAEVSSTEQSPSVQMLVGLIRKHLQNPAHQQLSLWVCHLLLKILDEGEEGGGGLCQELQGYVDQFVHSLLGDHALSVLRRNFGRGKQKPVNKARFSAMSDYLLRTRNKQQEVVREVSAMKIPRYSRSVSSWKHKYTNRFFSRQVRLEMPPEPESCSFLGTRERPVRRGRYGWQHLAHMRSDAESVRRPLPSPMQVVRVSCISQ